VKDAKNILTFRRMVTPWIVQWMFWLLVLIVLIIGVRNIFGQGNVFLGLLGIIFGVLFSRVICEIFVVTFRINETLMDIKEELKKKGKG